MAKLYSGDNVVDAQIDTVLDNSPSLDSDEEFERFFEIARIVKWIEDGEFKRTALQLPDGLLANAYRLSSTIERQCKTTKIYILADTSYRSCCIDDVAAQHANCDSLIHFGESCLSKTTERIPVLYVFGMFPLDVDDFCNKLDGFLESVDLTDTTVYLLCDSTFSHCQDELKDAIHLRLKSKTAFISLDLATTESINGTKIILGRTASASLTDNEESKKLLFFVGAKETKLLPIWLMTFPFFNQYIHYVPVTKVFSYDSSSTNRLLRKRLFLIEKLKDANVIGCVVGTLEVKGYKDAIQRVRQLCKAAGKKLYVLSIGKLNEAKLSNFNSDIDAFIMLSCPFGVVLDLGEFYKPIVSMFEAEIALNSLREWFASSGWTSEFNSFITDEIKAEDIDKTDVSLITGKVRGMHVEDESEIKNRQIMTYSAGDYFANRSWKGLDDAYNPEDSVEIKKGLTGTSMGYSSENVD